MKHSHILVVEDDPIASQMLAAWAHQHGSAVTSVANIVDGDAALSQMTFDLVISDVNLPGNEGLRWIERVVAAEFAPPVILITGSPGLETTLRAANLPIAGFLVKPPDLAHLSELCQRLVSDNRRRVELRNLAREAAWLLTTPGYCDEATLGPVPARLLRLSQLLAAEANRSPREGNLTGADDQPWRTAITDAIATLEKTKDSFRSKELGELRQRLQRALQNQP